MKVLVTGCERDRQRRRNAMGHALELESLPIVLADAEAKRLAAVETEADRAEEREVAEHKEWLSHALPQPHSMEPAGSPLDLDAPDGADEYSLGPKPTAS